MEQVSAKNALVTGASSGIGEAIAEKLLERGWQVYGTGRDFSRTSVKIKDNPAFHPVVVDFFRESKWVGQMRQLIRTVHFTLLVNNAGCAFYGRHDEIPIENIEEMVQVNLTVPMVLTRLLLPVLKQSGGTVIFVSSVTARAPANPHGAAYGATKAGLLGFAGSIFEESRKSGLRVASILPDMTRTGLYREADFDAADEPDAGLDPEDVADAVLYVLDRPAGVVIPELRISPQKHRLKKKK